MEEPGPQPREPHTPIDALLNAVARGRRSELLDSACHDEPELDRLISTNKDFGTRIARWRDGQVADLGAVRPAARAIHALFDTVLVFEVRRRLDDLTGLLEPVDGRRRQAVMRRALAADERVRERLCPLMPLETCDPSVFGQADLELLDRFLGYVSAHVALDRMPRSRRAKEIETLIADREELSEFGAATAVKNWIRNGADPVAGEALLDAADPVVGRLVRAALIDVNKRRLAVDMARLLWKIPEGWDGVLYKTCSRIGEVDVQLRQECRALNGWFPCLDRKRRPDAAELYREMGTRVDFWTFRRIKCDLDRLTKRQTRQSRRETPTGFAQDSVAETTDEKLRVIGIDADEAQELFDRLRSRLTPKELEVYELRVTQGLSNQHAARVLDKKDSAASALFKTAMAKLNDVVEEKMAENLDAPVGRRLAADIVQTALEGDRAKTRAARAPKAEKEELKAIEKAAALRKACLREMASRIEERQAEMIDERGDGYRMTDDDARRVMVNVAARCRADVDDPSSGSSERARAMIDVIDAYLEPESGRPDAESGPSA